ncbi:hypothetical protein CK203_049744 [Vitis vinifera]|uniref:Uncharacterized protein n=1 Tax=Vitis vinifera TaxID=29760 RepID=A0A438H0K9_VITVI|nr:hypothetical protein CK203_049744 [Vitis vinifera]
MNVATTLDISNASDNHVSNKKVGGNNGQNISERGRGPGLNKFRGWGGHGQASVFIATPELVSDQSWYANSGATNHVTVELENLSMKSDYHGEDKLVVDNEQRKPLGAAAREA